VKGDKVDIKRVSAIALMDFLKLVEPLIAAKEPGYAGLKGVFFELFHRWPKDTRPENVRTAYTKEVANV
jgi:hypothetical protein